MASSHDKQGWILESETCKNIWLKEKFLEESLPAERWSTNEVFFWNPSYMFSDVKWLNGINVWVFGKKRIEN